MSSAKGKKTGTNRVAVSSAKGHILRRLRSDSNLYFLSRGV
jgi:hypothetical protein